jgi:plastocyanin
VTIRVRLAPTRGCAVLAALACITSTGAADGGKVDPATRASPETHVVLIEQMRFNPPDLIVHRGDRVVWVNKDLFPHTATATSTAFDSRSIAPDASWPYLANRLGRYPYACTFHPTMRGTLTVR